MGAGAEPRSFTIASFRAPARAWFNPAWEDAAMVGSRWPRSLAVMWLLLLPGTALAERPPQLAALDPSAPAPAERRDAAPQACPEAAPCTWQRTFGGARPDKLRAAAAMPDGGLVVAGKTESHRGWRAAGWVLRLDPNGARIWERRIGNGRDTDAFTSVIPTDDGGVILVGHVRTQGAGESDGWLVKLDARGRTQWQRSLGGPENDRLLSATALPDGGLVAAGFTASRGAGDRDVWVLRADAQGRAVWQQTFGGPDDDGGFAVAYRDGAVTVAGHARGGDGVYDVWLARLDPDTGRAGWERRFHRSKLDAATAMAALPDGGVLVSALTSKGFGAADAWLLKVEADGNLAWDTVIGGPSGDVPWSVAALPDGGALVAASTQSQGAGSADAWLLRLDAEGAVLWQRTHGGDLWDWPGVALATPTGDLLLGGYTTSAGAGYEDGWVLRLDPQGRL
jgi:hypothetical protein